MKSRYEIPTWIAFDADYAPKEPRRANPLFEPVGCAVSGVLALFALIWFVWILHHTPDSAQVEAAIPDHAVLCETEAQCAALAAYLSADDQ